MAAGTELYRFVIDLSDVTRGVYERIDLRVPLHPSEDRERLVTRCLAYCLLFEPGLVFGKGLAEADDPSLHVTEGDRVLHWIDVGTPSAERIHRASKHALRLSIVCHKGADSLRREREKRKIFGAERVSVILVDPEQVRALAAILERNANWVVLRNDGELSVSVSLPGTPDQTFAADLSETMLSEL